MTDSLVFIALGFSAASLASFILFVSYLPTLRKAATSYQEGSNIVSHIVSEFDSRASAQDRRIADVQVKLDVVEGRMIRGSWPQSQGSVPYQPRIEYPVFSVKQSEENRSRAFNLNEGRMPVAESPVVSNKLSRTEAFVLQTLIERPLTAPEVKGLLGSSREHAARVMKSLTDRRFVNRDLSKRPYSYAISDVGRDVVTDRSR